MKRTYVISEKSDKNLENISKELSLDKSVIVDVLIETASIKSVAKIYTERFWNRHERS